MKAHANLITRLSFKPRFSIYLKSVSVCCALFFAAACASAPPSVPITETHAAIVLSPDKSLTNTYLALRQIPTRVPRNDVPEGDVPLAAQTLLTQLKHGLRELIGDTINHDDNRNATPLQLRTQVVERLAQDKIKVLYPNDEEPPEQIDPDINAPETQFLYGEVARIKITAPAHHPDLLVVTTTIYIPSGEDTSLYLFRRANDYWQIVLAHEANGYKHVTGAQAKFDYAVSPSDENGNFFIVAAHIPPWFVSCWRGLRYQVFRIGHRAYEPLNILSKDNFMYHCDEPPYTLNVRADGFKLSFHDQKWMDMLNEGTEISESDERSKTVVEYTIKGDKITEVSHK